MAGPGQPRAEEAAEARILQQQLDLFQTFWQQTLENINMVQSKIHEIHSVETKVTAPTCWRQMLDAGLELVLKECLRLKSRNAKLKKKISQLSRENSAPEERHGRILNDSQQITEQDNSEKSDLETPPQSMEEQEAKHLNFAVSLQECSDTEEEVQRDSETLQVDKAYTETKLRIELQKAKAVIDLLKRSLESVNQDRRKLSTTVANITRENQQLKEKLQVYKQAVSRYEQDLSQLTQERSPSTDHPWPAENKNHVMV